MFGQTKGGGLSRMNDQIKFNMAELEQLLWKALLETFQQALIFRREDQERLASSMAGMDEDKAETRSPLQKIYFLSP
jgi:hypothetical protein